MTKQTSKGPAINGKSTLIALGIGTVLAPFTGGASLIYAAATLGCYAAVDVATKDQSVDK